MFFREEPLPDPAARPEGRAGRAADAGPLDRGRCAGRALRHAGVARQHRAAVGDAAAPRCVLAQDTGSAITGAVRADYFWGWGEDAEAQAGRMKQPLRMWVLLPRC